MKPSERFERIERNLEFLVEGAARHEAAAARHEAAAAKHEAAAAKHDQEIAELREMQGRAWNAIEALADKQAKLDDSLATLTEAQIKTEERFQRTDERIDTLVSAIGELIRHNGGA